MIDPKEGGVHSPLPPPDAPGGGQGPRRKMAGMCRGTSLIGTPVEIMKSLYLFVRARSSHTLKATRGAGVTRSIQSRVDVVGEGVLVGGLIICPPRPGGFVVTGDATADGIRAVRSVLGAISSPPIVIPA